MFQFTKKTVPKVNFYYIGCMYFDLLQVTDKIYHIKISMWHLTMSNPIKITSHTCTSICGVGDLKKSHNESHMKNLMLQSKENDDWEMMKAF